MFSRRKHAPADDSQEPDSPSEPFDVTGYRARVAAGADWQEGARIVGHRIGEGPYESEHPLHHLAVDANALRCEAHAIAAAHPDEPRLRLVASVLDVAADGLDDYAAAVGL